MKKVYKRLPMIVFLLFIGVMFVLFFALPKKEYSSSEKRYLAQAPQFDEKKLFSGDFRDDAEKYIEDHTAGRDLWVGLAAYYNLSLGNNGAKGVYNGRDGYLINDPEEMTDLARNAGFIEEFANHMQTRLNVPTTVMVAPSTGYICEDKLPAVHKEYHDNEAFTELQNTFQAAKFVDIREDLKGAYQNGEQVFYRTDHHWTTFGAYTAYRALGKPLGIVPNDESIYEKTAYQGFYGTTYSTSGFWMTAPDEIEVWDNPDNEIKVTIDDGEVIKNDDMFFDSHLDEDDKYPVFLDGNHSYTVIENQKSESKETLMVVKDSFAHSLVPFLADHYRKIIMVDMRYYAMPLQPIIEKEAVDRVLFVYSLDNLATDVNIGFIE